MTQRKKGKVIIVGAGPGDPGLFTMKGVEALQVADVVIYDRLVHPKILNSAASHTKKVYAGKQPGRQELSQAEINSLVLKLATEGKTVVRLKGGDPYLFGRGAEEAEALKKHSIPFKIVPGVTSAVAVPGLAGIPVTHRKHSSSLAIVTGHEDPTKPFTRVNWEKIASAVDTIVVLMGMENLSSIMKRILSSGKPATTPVAVIEWGTIRLQRVLTGNIGNITRKVKAAKMHPPSVIVIGDVVRLKQLLDG
ncbi:MAG: uroporphyrinogen-III C-methyltransferase [Candidatus Bathyarchaeia archaeon]